MINRKVIRRLPPGGEFADFKTYTERDMGGRLHRCVRWTWMDRGMIRVALFDLETGEYISEV